MSIKGVEEHHEAPVKASKGRKCKTHCRKLWWAYLIAAAAIIVIVVCLIIFVGVPKIAQHKIDESKLEIQGVNILETEENQFLMQVNSTIETDGKIKAKIDPFVGDLYLEGAEPYVPFGSLEFPETSGDAEQIVNISQIVKITDLDAFTKFNIWFVNNETLQMTIKGETYVQPSGLSRKSKVNFEKTLDVTGLNGLKGTTVTEGEILKKPNAQGMNFIGKSTIPNPSHFTLDIGNATFKNFIGDELVGTLFINNLVLRPGDNDVDVTANLTQGPVLAAVTSEQYCKTGIVPFKLMGENVTNHGQNLTYFAAALASANQTVPMNVADIINSSLGFRPGCGSNE